MRNIYLVILFVIVILGGIYFTGEQNIFLGETVDRGYEGLYVLDITGNLFVSGSAEYMGDLSYSRADVVDLEVVDKGYYILDSTGKVYNFGESVFYGDANVKDATDLEVVDKGYYILDMSGVVLPYGFINKYGDGSKDNYVDLEVSNKGYYLLSETGEIEVFGDAIFYGNLEGGYATDLELTKEGYVILEEGGKLHFFGDADFDILEEIGVVDLELLPDADGYFLLDGQGTLYSYKAAAGYPGPEFKEDMVYIDLELMF